MYGIRLEHWDKGLISQKCNVSVINLTDSLLKANILERVKLVHESGFSPDVSNTL